MNEKPPPVIGRFLLCVLLNGSKIWIEYVSIRLFIHEKSPFFNLKISSLKNIRVGGTICRGLSFISFGRDFNPGTEIGHSSLSPKFVMRTILLKFCFGLGFYPTEACFFYREFKNSWRLTACFLLFFFNFAFSNAFHLNVNSNIRF